jgi:glycosyltransferase involved in cell wall biosynthesis
VSSAKVAIVHDWLYGGGAELVVEQLHTLYPDAPIYTSYCSDEWRTRLNNKVVTGHLQHWPFAQLRKFLPVLRQRWFKKLDLHDFDLVISSSGNGEAKFVTAKKPAVHVCYCHTPTHFYWRKYNEYLKNPSFRPKWLVRLGLRLLVKPLRKRDYQAAQNVDYFIANSSHIQKDIEKFYNRESVIIHPPVSTEKFSPQSSVLSPQSASNPSFIMWGRHVPYKRFDLAIEACNQLGLPLTIAGTGPETPHLKKIAGPTITFTGFVTHDELVSLAKQASAFIFPGEEDFGIAPVEAIALGLPVIAYKAGGALDYVIEGKTGTLFEKQTRKSLEKSLTLFDPDIFNPSEISKVAKKFSLQEFNRKITETINTIASKD